MLKTISRRHRLMVAAACAALGLFLGAAGRARPEEAPLHESALCLDCHGDQATALAGTAHAVAAGAGAHDIHVACTDCHGSNRKHWEEAPDQNPMVIPSALDPAAEARLCATCHQSAHQQNMLAKNIHASSGVNCSACHSVHASARQTALLTSPEPGLCYGCHATVQGEFAKSYRHPVSDGVMKCSDCHRTLDETSRELSLNGTNVCVRCHAEVAGPFPYEHEATLDFSTAEGGCLNCHAAHGSDNPKLLTQPYEPPRFQVCTQCHQVPAGHSFNPEHGTRWAGRACNTCHADIHGSFDNRLFLDQSIRAQGCLAAGCHGH